MRFDMTCPTRALYPRRMNDREISTEVARLRQLAKALLGALEALEARLESTHHGVENGAPAQRPTTRMRKPQSSAKTPSLRPGRPDDPTTPASARGAYRIVPPKR